MVTPPLEYCVHGFCETEHCRTCEITGVCKLCTRQSEREESRVSKPSAPTVLPSAPVTGRAVTARKPLHIAGFLNAAASSCEAVSAIKESTYPVRRSHRGGLRLHSDRRPSSTVGNESSCAGAPADQVVASLSGDVEVLSASPPAGWFAGWPAGGSAGSHLGSSHHAGVGGDTRRAAAAGALARLVGWSGRVHQSTRRLVDRRNRKRLLRRLPVLDRHVGVGGWARFAVAGVAVRADLQGVAGVVAGRRVVGGVGNRGRVRAGVIA